MAEKETQTAGTPRWVKVFGIIALLLLLLVVIALLVGKGDHGPGRHTPRGHTGPPPGVTHEQP
jgi:ABC-type transporter Mla subunit MlaD